MTKFIFFKLSIISLILVFTNCDKDDDSVKLIITNEVANASLGIESLPASFSNKHKSNFDRYTKHITPNGGVIHIFAQNTITNEQIVRCRSILQHFLTDYKGSVYGNDKSAIANKMAENGASLYLLNGQDDGTNPYQPEGQPLYKNEIQVEGHEWYTNQDYSHRDAAYEEILHMVHDYGIGVDGAGTSPGVSPAFQKEIRSAQTNALSSQIWGIGSPDWIKELTKENSLSQEYLAAVIDVYYGLWGANVESSTHGMHGLYVAKLREDIKTEDPIGQQLLENKFFHPYITYNARIDSSFVGTFSLKYAKAIPYSNHSQYLKDITLLGSKDTKLRVNGFDNHITGNKGTNTIIFSGKYSEYTVDTSGDITTVQDKTTDRDGTNVLKLVEKLKFSDHQIIL
jgi:hypothetical protein